MLFVLLIYLLDDGIVSGHSRTQREVDNFGMLKDVDTETTIRAGDWCLLNTPQVQVFCCCNLKGVIYILVLLFSLQMYLKGLVKIKGKFAHYRRKRRILWKRGKMLNQFIKSLQGMRIAQRELKVWSICIMASLCMF